MAGEPFRAERQDDIRRGKSSRTQAKWQEAARELKRLRLGKGMSQKELMQKLENVTDRRLYSARYLRKIERGERRPPRCYLIPLLTRVLEVKDIQALGRILGLYEFNPLSDAEINTNVAPELQVGGHLPWLPLTVKSADRPDLRQIGLSIFESLGKLGFLCNPMV
jgi:transcriptional regulator with XRE-family HTH domain